VVEDLWVIIGIRLERNLLLEGLDLEGVSRQLVCFCLKCRLGLWIKHLRDLEVLRLKDRQYKTPLFRISVTSGFIVYR